MRTLIAWTLTLAVGASASAQMDRTRDQKDQSSGSHQGNTGRPGRAP